VKSVNEAIYCRVLIVELGNTERTNINEAVCEVVNDVAHSGSGTVCGPCHLLEHLQLGLERRHGGHQLLALVVRVRLPLARGLNSSTCQLNVYVRQGVHFGDI